MNAVEQPRGKMHYIGCMPDGITRPSYIVESSGILWMRRYRAWVLVGGIWTPSDWSRSEADVIWHGFELATAVTISEWRKSNE